MKTPPNRITTSIRIEHIKGKLNKKAATRKKKLHEYIVDVLEKDVKYKKK